MSEFIKNLGLRRALEEIQKIDRSVTGKSSKNTAGYWIIGSTFSATEEKVTAVVVEVFNRTTALPPNGFKSENIKGFGAEKKMLGAVQYTSTDITCTVNNSKGFQHFGGFKLGKTDIAVLKNPKTDAILFSELKSKKQEPKSFKVDIPEDLKGAELIGGVFEKTGPVQLWFNKNRKVCATLVLDETTRKVVEYAALKAADEESWGTETGDDEVEANRSKFLVDTKLESNVSFDIYTSTSVSEARTLNLSASQGGRGMLASMGDGAEMGDSLETSTSNDSKPLMQYPITEAGTSEDSTTFENTTVEWDLLSVETSAEKPAEQSSVDQKKPEVRSSLEVKAEKTAEQSSVDQKKPGVGDGHKKQQVSGYIALGLLLAATTLGVGYVWRKGHLARVQMWMQSR